MKKHFVILCLLAVSTTLTAHLTHAEGVDDYYVVELTLFTNDNPDNINEEKWRSELTLNYPDYLAYFTHEKANTVFPELAALARQAKKSAEGNADDNEGSDAGKETTAGKAKETTGPVFLPLLDDKWRRHKDSVTRIGSSKKYSVIFSQAWLQKMESDGNSPNIVIQAGKMKSGIHQIGGTINIFKERYLHLRTNLWLVQFAEEGKTTAAQPAVTIPVNTNPINTNPGDKNLIENMVPAEAASIEELLADTTLKKTQWPLPPTVTIPDFKRTSARTDSGQPKPAGKAPDDSVASTSPVIYSPAIERIVTMQERRKMRSREIHYIDHPLFGMLIEIRPYTSEPD